MEGNAEDAEVFGKIAMEPCGLRTEWNNVFR